MQAQMQGILLKAELKGPSHPSATLGMLGVLRTGPSLTAATSSVWSFCIAKAGTCPSANPQQRCEAEVSLGLHEVSANPET